MDEFSSNIILDIFYSTDAITSLYPAKLLFREPSLKRHHIEASLKTAASRSIDASVCSQNVRVASRGRASTVRFSCL